MNVNKNPLVSVIIPVFNGAAFVKDAVNSVLSQTYQNYEIVVVDDGSTDNTKSVLEPWTKAGTIQYVFQENKGLAGARNTGIRHSKGQYLKFLDADDLLYSEQLERQVNHLNDQPDSVISATNYELEFENKRKVPINLHLKSDQLAQFIEGNPCPGHTLLVPRKLIEAAGSFDEKLLSHEDSDLWLRIIQRGGSFEKVDYLGCCYRIIGGALSADIHKMFRHACFFSENLNGSLMPQFSQLGEDVLRQLYYRNMQNIHKCFAQSIKPEAWLPVTLKATEQLHAMKARGLGKLIFNLTGIEGEARKQYRQARRADPQYPKKILQTAWRDERFYERHNGRYREVETVNLNVKNILYLNSSAVIYGAETRLLDIIRTLDRSRFRPFALIPHMGPLDARLKELGVTTVHIEYSFPINNSNRFKIDTIKRWLRSNRELVWFVRNYKIDLIHANLHINVGHFWLALLILRRPLIVHMRSHFWLRKFEKFLICRATKAIFISKFVEREFFKIRRSSFLMFQRKGNYSEILHDGIDVKHFSPKSVQGKIRQELNIGPKDFFVGIIGAIDKIKGQDLLIEAANMIVPKHPHAKFVVVGDLYHNGKSSLIYRVQLHNMIKAYRLENNFIFTGFRADINLFMNELDLLVQPSEREALGTSMVEAMACGKPVIGTKVDGIPEVIGNNEGGILLDPRTPEALAEAINFFIEHPEEARQRGAQGRQRVLRLFNIFENIKHIQRIYNHALGDKW